MVTEFSKSAISKDFPRFMKMVKKRLMAGAEAYGDMSFGRNPEALADEISEEIMDIIGWGFILLHRMERVKDATKNLPTP
jgi:hypothetical protein